MEDIKPASCSCGSPNTVLDPDIFFHEQPTSQTPPQIKLEPIPSISSCAGAPAGGQVAGHLYPGPQVKLVSKGVGECGSQVGGGLISQMGQGIKTCQTREQSQQASSGPEEENYGGASMIGPDGMKRGAWTKEEDAMLAEYVQQFGAKDWSSVPMKTKLVNRCGKSCRLRYVNHLRPNLKKEAFTEAEEQLVIQLQAQLGNKWAAIAGQMPGRTDNEIKNLWNTRIKKRKRGPELHARPQYRWPQAARSYSDGDNSSMPALVSVEEWNGRRVAAGNARRSASVPLDGGAYVFTMKGTASGVSTPSVSSGAAAPVLRPPSAASCRSRLSNTTRSLLTGRIQNPSRCSPLVETKPAFASPNKFQEAFLFPTLQLEPERALPTVDFGAFPSNGPSDCFKDEPMFSPPKEEDLPTMPDQMIGEETTSEPSTTAPSNSEKTFQRQAFIEKLRLDPSGGGVHWAANLETGGSFPVREEAPETGTPAWTPSSGTIPSFLRASTPKARTPGFHFPFALGNGAFSHLCETPMGGLGSFDVFPSPAGYQKTVKTVTDEMMALDDVAELSSNSF